MNKVSIGLVLLITFAAGVIVGNPGSLNLREARAAQQWEYQCDWARSSSTLTRELNDHSRNGWELVNVTHSGNAPYYCLKR